MATVTSFIPLPAALHTFFSKFPLYTYPSIPPSYSPSKTSLSRPTLWIQAPKPKPSANLLSADVECLKWQAYIALRGVNHIGVRWDVSPAGGVEGRLPCLQTPGADGEVLGARAIPGWADGVLEKDGEDAYEGYKDEAAKDESRAWVSLLEGAVHAALILHQPAPPIFSASLIFSSADSSKSSLATLLTPPPAPLSGLWSILPPYGERINPSTINMQYREAIVSLSERLGSDRWFLDSAGPTALDALAFAYLHTLLDTSQPTRIIVSQRANLVAWELRVRETVQSAFQTATSN